MELIEHLIELIELLREHTASGRVDRAFDTDSRTASHTASRTASHTASHTDSHDTIVFSKLPKFNY